MRALAADSMPCTSEKRLAAEVAQGTLHLRPARTRHGTVLGFTVVVEPGLRRSRLKAAGGARPRCRPAGCA